MGDMMTMQRYKNIFPVPSPWLLFVALFGKIPQFCIKIPKTHANHLATVGWGVTFAK